MFLPASAVLGAIFLVLADIIARTLIAPNDIPIDILTSFIGELFFSQCLSGARYNDLSYTMYKGLTYEENWGDERLQQISRRALYAGNHRRRSHGCHRLCGAIRRQGSPYGNSP
ncbi:iron chelate uptake ABC transporter family permease subunit [Brucella endophytica]|uniref:iron chelate uptake ABC transporter family permease subunit n=1 Tax=Brucella endophytica TaxID=1963359 RepID=UPI001AEE59EB|nr:iron chelate uptake ABC transporter family permease subunit [Brucella endophytica]